MRKKSRYAAAAIVAGGLLTGALGIALPGSAEAVIWYTLDSTNATQSSVRLTATTLGNTTLGNPSTLTLGTNTFNYAALLFRPNEVSASNITYTFGITSAAFDPVMILYLNRFDPTRPGWSALVGNDDTPVANHRAIAGASVSVSCGGNTGYCPQISQVVTPAQITQGQPFTLFISTYNPGVAVPLGIRFYASSPGDFGSMNDLALIDTGKTYYRLFDLDFLVKPDFRGGTLRVDTNSFSYGQNFSLSNAAGNTLDLYGNTTTISGIISDAVAGTPGFLALSNSNGSGDGTLNLTGQNTFTGGLTIGNGVRLNITDAANLGAEAARLTLNGGRLNIGTNAVSTSRPVTIGASGGTIDNATALTLSGVIDGSGTLVKTGSGSLTLLGNNTFSGTLSLNTGSLMIGTGTVGSLANANIVNGTSVVFNRSDASTYSGIISGAGSVTKQGTGTLTVSGANTYTGGTSITAGVLAVSSDSNLGGAGGLSINGGTLRTTAAMTSGKNVTIGASNATIDALDTLSLSGTIGGTGRLTKTGAGILTLSGTNTYSGGTTISAGTLAISSDANLGVVAAGLTIDGGTLRATGMVSSARAITLGAGNGTIETQNVATFSGVISGSGRLTKTGAGFLVLTGNNAYTGGTTVSAGTLQIGDGGTSGSVAGNIVNNADITFNRSDDFSYAGVISGTGSIWKTENGTLVLTGDNTYTGLTVVNYGTLQLGNGGTSGSLAGDAISLRNSSSLVFNRSNTLTYGGVISGTGSVTKQGAGTLVLTGDNTYTGVTTIDTGSALQLGAGGGGASGSIAGHIIDNGALLFSRSNAVTYAGVISGSGTLTQAGGSMLTLTGNNTYTGTTTVASGTLQLGDGGTSGSIAGASISLQNSSGLFFNRSNAMTYSGVISGNGYVTKLGADTLTLAGANTYTGGTTISAGTLQIGNGGNTGSLAGNIVNDGNLSFSRSDAVTHAGAISGSGSVRQQGSGVLTLTGANSYTGGTTVSAGTLRVTGATALGAGLVTNNATFDLAFASNAAFANALSGSGLLTKTGSGVATLTGGGSMGSVSVNAGTLGFGQSGVFTAGSYTTASGAVTSLGGDSRLAVTNAFTQTAGSTLNVNVSSVSQPVITAETASLSGTLNISGYTGSQTATASALTSTLITIVNTANGISGDFSSVTLGGAGSTVDYLTLEGRKSADTKSYTVGFGLSWYADTNAHGTFTLDNPADTFNVDMALNDQAASGGWDGTSLTKNGFGMLILSAVNGYTGDTTINAGTIRTGVANAIAASNSLTLGGPAAIFDLDGHDQSVRNLSGLGGEIRLGSAQLTANNTVGIASFAGTISGTGSLVKTGTGILVLGAGNTYSGGTTVTGGALSIGSDDALGAATGGLTLNGGTLHVQGAMTSARAVTLGSSNGTLDSDFAVTLSGLISGAGSLTKTGTGTLTLTANNSYAGTTTISGGALRIGDGGTSGSVAGNIVNNASLVFDRSDVWSYGGAISGSGSLTKQGSGTLTLTGANTYTGNTFFNGGVIAIDSNTQIGSGAFIFNGGTLRADAALSINNAVTINTSGTIDTNGSGDYYLTGQISGAGRLIKEGQGTLRLAGNNTYTGGTSIAEGLLSIGSGGEIGSGTLAFDGGSLKLLSSSSTIANNMVLNTDGTISNDYMATGATLSGNISGTGSLIKADSGSLVLSGNNTYTGSTVITGGNIVISSAANIGSGSVVFDGSYSGLTVLNDASLSNTVVLNGYGTIAANTDKNVLLSGNISGAGVLITAGDGVLTLTGNNTFSGGTTISSSTRITHGGALGTGDIYSEDTLELNFAGDSTLANTLVNSSMDTLIKSGLGVARLTGGGGATHVLVNEGTLALDQNGEFYSLDYTTANGATTSLGGASRLRVGDAFTQAAGSTLNVAIGSTNIPAIMADTASLAGTLNITGFTGSQPTTASALVNTLVTIVDTTSGITGDFSSVTLGGAGSTVDYLTLAGRKSADSKQYNVGFGLSWYAATNAHGTFTLANAADTFTVDMALDDQGASGSGWDGRRLIKEGAGTLVLSAVNGYSGETRINAGTLRAGIVNAFAQSSEVSIASGATLSLDSFDQTVQHLQGSGSIALGAAYLTLQNNNNTLFSGAISGSGSVIKTGVGDLTLSGANTYSGLTTISEGSLTIGYGLTGSISGNILNNASLIFDRNNAMAYGGNISGSGSVTQYGSGTLSLTGTNTYTGGTTISWGTLRVTHGGALGSGLIFNNAALELDFATNSVLANTISDYGVLTKNGIGVATLTGGGGATSVAVNAGTLSFGQNGTFTANSYVTASGAATSLGGLSLLTVTNAFTQAAGSTLNVNVGSLSQSAITANTASLAGTLNITGFSGSQPIAASALADTLVTIVNTVNGISGDFSSVTLGGAGSTVDYLTLEGRKSADAKSYTVGFGLSWLAAANAHGTFTLANAADTFNVDMALNNQAASGGWDGTSLTKAGAGTLILSSVNGYTGATSVSAGTLRAGVAGAFAQSGSVTVSSGATLDLNSFNQTAKNLSGSGSIALGLAALTAQNNANTAFSGSIGGSGSLVKTGSGVLTLSGNSGYTGGTTVSAGTLQVTGGTALGQGGVTNSATLDLAFASDDALANALAGSGAMTKTGSGTATLTGGGSMGSVSVNEGTLAFGQSGVFTAGNYTTASGASTSLGENSRLGVTNTFTQAAGSTLNVNVGSLSLPAITANTALLSGTLNIADFGSSQPIAASALADTLVSIVQTTNGITGDFASVTLGGAGSTVDYLTLEGRKSADNKNYTVGFGLSWLAAANAHGTFTLTNAADVFTVDMVLNNQAASGGWDGVSLTKEGAGTLILSAVNGYTGATSINAGTLQAGIAGAFAQSGSVAVSSGATLDLNGFNQTAKNLSGAGSVELGSAVLTAQNNANTAFSGSIGGSGSLVKTGSGVLTLSGDSGYTGGTTVSAGTLQVTGGTALGQGAVANNATLDLAFASDDEFANALSGSGALTKNGIGIATLTSGGSMGSVSVNEGTLSFSQTGVFTAGSYTTANGAATSLGGPSHLAVANGFTQAAGSTLNVNVGSVILPVITANTASLSGTLNITNFAGPQPTTASALVSTLVTIVQTVNGITGDFSSVNLGGAGSTVDYLTLAGRKSADDKSYTVGFGLSWLAATNAHGTFTLADAADTFTVDMALNNQAASGGWDGTSLTKAGAGRLILSAVNGYTGATNVNAGTLQTGIAGAFAQSGSVAVASGATLDLNGFDQTARNLSGAGLVELGSAVLTAQNNANTAFSGSIGGSGSLVKTGSGVLTLSGDSNYTGGTTVSAGTLQVTGGTALGLGAVSNNATLDLAFAGPETLANALSGSGALTKNGIGIATLTGGGSMGSVSVNEGTLSFGQTGVFTAGSYTTASGASTSLGENSRLGVTNAFTQAVGSALNVMVGSLSQSAITANTASLSGTLNITGFSGSQPTLASALVNTLVTIVQTTSGITGDFSSVNLGGAGSTVDYLTLAGRKSADDKSYTVGFGLSWLAATNAHGTFTLTNAADTFTVDMALNNQAASGGWDGTSLTKEGAGTLILSAVNGYTGTTSVNAGTLQAGIAGAFAQSGSVAVASGATLNLNGFDQTARNLSGAGSVELGSAVLTAQSGVNTEFSGSINGSGSLVKTGSGVLTLSGDSGYMGGTTVSAGTLQVTNGTALGLGAVSNNATLDLVFASNDEFANALSGSGALTKNGIGIATLTGGGSMGSVSVNEGTLSFGQTGMFTAGSYMTASGASTSLGENSRLGVANAFTQAVGSALNVTIGSLSQPVITADTASLAGTLNITGFSGSQPTTASALVNTLVTIVQTTNGITGDFSSVTLGGAGSTVDYLTLAGRKSADDKSYTVGFGLSWLAAANAHGTFTLTNAADMFNVDMALNNQAASGSWDGTSLTKEGAGTLILSAVNGYTGTTSVNAGTLQAGIAGAFAQSGSVAVASGATLDLNGFDQTARNLSGAGSVELGSAVLTAQNNANTAFSGSINGSGSLVKTGSGVLTLSGDSGYTGGTTVSAGTLQVTGGTALGLGVVSNSATLDLVFASNDEFANALSGSGALTKNGIGTATLTGGGSMGSVSVNEGTLSFGQTGVFTAGSYTTANGAATSLSGLSRLAVTNGFTQSAGSTLNVNVGSVSLPVITANTASLAGALNITGFSGTMASTASTLLASQVTLIEATGGITGDFAPININGTGSSTDYIQLSGYKTDADTKYKIGFGLSWLAAANAHGTFTLTNASDTFNVDIALNNQTASGGWDGMSLTKEGAGTLILSANNTYTGVTQVQAGTLQIGNGGTTGAVAGNIVNNAALVFNRSNAMTYGGVISGSGSLTKNGAGILTLTGANTYTGATIVNAGTLRAGINDAFASSSSVTVASGATLSLGSFDQTLNNLAGTGTVAYNDGNLTLHNDADTVFSGTLLAGSLLRAVPGNLVLTGSATLELTNSNTVVGNVDVQEGVLSLKQTGTLSASGDFTTRSGATTILAGEPVKLNIGGVFTQEAGSTLNVTVGSAPDIIADSAVLDGALELQGFAGGGSVAPIKASDISAGQLYTLIRTTSGITGDFASTPLQATGLDYVLHSGSVSQNGLDYQLGFKLAWTDGGPAQSTGSFTLASGTAFNVDVALSDQAGTFASGWDGKSLTKNGAGLLVLSAANDYTGGTTINDGTLQISSDANLGDAASGLTFNGGSLATTQSFTSNRSITLNSGLGTFDVANDTVLTLTGDLTGAGGLIKAEIGKLVMEGTNSYTGRTIVDAGALIAGRAGAFSTASDYRINLGAVLALQGYDQTVANLDNAGNLHIGSGDGSRVGGRLTVSGTYISNGGNLFLNTVLGDDGSLTDKLVVGAVRLGSEGVSITSGGSPSATKVYITNVGGLGAKTTGDGIEVVHVNDASQSAAGAFILARRVAAGAYDYDLLQGGVGGNASDGNWYLRTVDDGYRSETVVNVTVPQTVAKLGLSTIGGYSGRDDDGLDNGGESVTGDSSNDPRCQDPVYAKSSPQCLQLPKTYLRDSLGRTAWARLLGETGEVKYGGDPVASFEKHGASYDYTMGGFIAGMDLFQRTAPDGSSDTMGLYVSAARLTSDARSIYGDGKAGSTSVDGYTVGGYWRHAWASGFYLDTALQGTHYGAIETTSSAGQSMNTHGWAMLGSVEAGYKLKLGEGWTLEPQVQAIYQRGSIQNNGDSYGLVKFHDTDEYYVRLGLRTQKQWELENGMKMQMYGRVNLWHGFGPDAKTTFTALDGSSPVTLGSQSSATWAQFTVGVGGQLSRNTTIFVSGDYNLPFGANKGYSIGGRAGLKVTW